MKIPLPDLITGAVPWDELRERFAWVRDMERARSWVEQNLEACLVKQAGRDEIVLDPEDNNFSGHLASLIAGVIHSQYPELNARVEVRPTCGYGDDHFSHQNHVILTYGP